MVSRPGTCSESKHAASFPWFTAGTGWVQMSGRAHLPAPGWQPSSCLCSSCSPTLPGSPQCESLSDPITPSQPAPSSTTWPAPCIYHTVSQLVLVFLTMRAGGMSSLSLYLSLWLYLSASASNIQRPGHRNLVNRSDSQGLVFLMIDILTGVRCYLVVLIAFL